MSDEEDKTFKYVDPDLAFVIHPNVLAAFLHYNGDHEAFLKEMREGKDGHNDEFDDYMREIAADRTIAQAILGWEFQKSKRRKK